jgi:DNA-directed RNA polymerase subunit M/transcription elongation factor TFIIS
MQARCKCTMARVGPRKWVKPRRGYRSPQNDCPKCNGTGFLPVRFPSEIEIEALWIGRCSKCGSENGGYFQRKGRPSPLDDAQERRWPAPCLNSHCPSPSVTWVKVETIERVWYALCPICNSKHWCNYLQIEGSAEPTPETQVLQCPQETCGHRPMMWVLASEST